MTIDFFAAGIPVPQGSMRAFTNKATGKAVLTSTSTNLKPWRETVGWAAKEAAQGRCFECPVAVTATFSLPRPVSAPKKRLHPDRKPDLDKLARGLLDALTGVVFKDDALVVSMHVAKRYAELNEQPGVRVIVAEMVLD